MPQIHESDFPAARILVVDDDRKLLQALKIRLSAIGCRCIACNNSSEAITQFAINAVDLIITDLTMPGIDGVGFIGLIRSQSNIPVIVITGNIDEYGLLLRGHDRVSILQKPFEMKNLTRCVHEFLPQIQFTRPVCKS